MGRSGIAQTRVAQGVPVADLPADTKVLPLLKFRSPPPASVFVCLTLARKMLNWTTLDRALPFLQPVALGYSNRRNGDDTLMAEQSRHPRPVLMARRTLLVGHIAPAVARRRVF